MNSSNSSHTHILTCTCNNKVATAMTFHAPTNEFAGKMARAYIKSLIPLYKKAHGIVLTKENFRLNTIQQPQASI